MKIIPHTLRLLALSGAAALAFSPSLYAQMVIISDGFSTNAAGGPASNNDPLGGRTPDTTNLPGGTYTTSTNSPFSGYEQPSVKTVPGGAFAGTGFNGSDSISIASTGTFAKPTTLTLSAAIEINTLAEGDGGQFARGVGLGFFNGTPPPTQNGVNANFYGLQVAPGGALYLVLNGTRNANAIAPAFTGFSTSNFYVLTYTVNTATGDLTNISFGGQDDGSLPAALAGASTDRVGFFGTTSANPGFTGFVDNFVVSGAVPEPSTWALLGLGAGALCLGVRQRRAHGA